jgi:hypothetical protein
LFPFNGENGTFSKLMTLDIEALVGRLSCMSTVRKILFGEEL